MPPTRIACRDNGKPFFAYLRNRGIYRKQAFGISQVGALRLATAVDLAPHSKNSRPPSLMTSVALKGAKPLIA